MAAPNPAPQSQQPRTPPPAQEPAQPAMNERQPLVARVRANAKYAGATAGATVTFAVKRDAEGAWHATANGYDLGAAPRHDAAWRIVDAEMRRCAHALTTDADEAKAAAEGAAKVAETTPGNQMFRAYKRQAQLAKEAARATYVRTERSKLEAIGIDTRVLAEATRIIAERDAAAKK